MSLARLLRNRWVLAGGGLLALIYFGLLTLFLVRLLDSRAEPVSPAPPPDGPLALTLNRQGEVLAGEHPLSASEVPGHLRRLAAVDRSSIQVTVPANVPYRRVYEVLKLCQAAGFAEHELRQDDQAGHVVGLAGEPKLPDDPDAPLDDQMLMLPTRTRVEVESAKDGSLARILIDSPAGRVAVPDPATLTRYLRLNQEDTGATTSVVTVSGSARLACGILLEVLAACREAGCRNLELAAPLETLRRYRDPYLD